MRYHIQFDIDLRRNPYKGLYIALEGIDGCGKTTQVKRLRRYFEEKGRKVVVTSEPNSDLAVGRLVKRVLQSKISLPAPALQYLYSADRVVNHETVVTPALKRGDIVLSHRSFWSAIPYGVMDKIMDTPDAKYDWRVSRQILIAQGILSMYHQFVVPDLTCYLEVSVDTAMRRLAKLRRTKEIYEKKDMLSKIIRGYTLLLKEFAHEIVVVDGEQSPEKVANEILDRIN